MKRVLLATMVLSTACPLRASPLSPYLWRAAYDNPHWDFDDFPAGMVLSGGHIYITGWSDSATVAPSPPTAPRFFTLSYAADGTSLDWTANPAGYRAGGIAADELGNVYVVGHGWNTDTTYDFATAKYSSSGQELWARSHDGGFNKSDHGYHIAVSGGSLPWAFVTGSSQAENGALDFLTLAYDTDGNVAWGHRYVSPSAAQNLPAAIAVHQGRVTVTGLSRGGMSHWDFATIQYSAADGSELWSDRYNGSANGDDMVYALAVDDDGERVYVTGKSTSQTPGEEFATIAYDQDGGRLWVKRWAGSGSGSNHPYAIAARGGAVYVAGASWASGTGYDLALVKYDRDDLTGGYGREVWVKRYDGPGADAGLEYGDAAVGMAIGPNGLVHITGSTRSEGPAALTLKYSPSGFQVGPVRCYDAGIWDIGRFIAVDAAGDAYVVGRTLIPHVDFGPPEDYDILTVKYPSSADKFKFIGSWHKVASLIGAVRFHDPVDMEGSMEVEVADIVGFPGEALAVTSMELSAASRETFRLTYPRPREDPVLAAMHGRVPGSFLLNTARDRSTQAWVALEGDTTALDRGFQGYCILPQPEVGEGLFSGDPEHPLGIEFTKSRTRGFPPGLGVYQYRVRCPDPEGTTGCDVELRLHGIITLTAKPVPQFPVSSPNCVKASDFYAQPQQGLTAAVLGPVTVQAALDSAGTTRPLEIADTNADGLVDLFVRWSRIDAMRPAVFDFSQVCAPGLPISVTITFTTLGDDVVWEALRGTVKVDSHVSIVGPAPQTVSFTPAGGLDKVWIREGFDVCIHEICWQCPPLAPAACQVADLEAEAGQDGITGSFKLTGELARDARSRLTFSLHDLDGNAADLEGRLSLETPAGTSRVTFSIDGRCDELLPDGEPGFLCVSAPCTDGLSGADCIAVRCPTQQGGKQLQRGDCNGDRANDISDAVFNLGFLFLGGDPPGCAEACDMNADGASDISDSVYLLAHLFLGGPPPAAPFPDCGTAPGPAGRLGCERSACE